MSESQKEFVPYQ